MKAYKSPAALLWKTRHYARFRSGDYLVEFAHDVYNDRVAETVSDERENQHTRYWYPETSAYELLVLEGSLGGIDADVAIDYVANAVRNAKQYLPGQVAIDHHALSQQLRLDQRYAAQQIFHSLDLMEFREWHDGGAFNDVALPLVVALLLLDAPDLIPLRYHHLELVARQQLNRDWS